LTEPEMHAQAIEGGLMLGMKKRPQGVFLGQLESKSGHPVGHSSFSAWGSSERRRSSGMQHD